MTARLALSAAFEPGNAAVGLLVAEHGAVGAVNVLCSKHDLTAGLSVLRRRWHAEPWLRQAHEERDNAAAQGVALVCPESPAWPTQLDDLQERAPLALRVKGTLELRRAAARSVAVVGARAATRYGTWAAEELCAQLASQGWCVVSGGAVGIDAASHRGALAVNGPTIAVSAAGVDLPVPPSNDALFSRLYDEGAVVSEVPLGAHPNRQRFLVRNRVIAALAPLVVVVEAALRSGALSTAREADAMGRWLCAVPGPITSAMSAGCHDLIRRGGATLVTSADDVIDQVLHSATPSTELAVADAEIDLIERNVLDLCAPRSMTALQVAQLVGISPDLAGATLHLLERKSLVARTAKGWRATSTALS